MNVTTQICQDGVPVYTWTDVSHGVVQGGLTKRELFAAMAMQGFVACSPDPISDHLSLAIESVRMADALIAALESK